MSGLQGIDKAAASDTFAVLGVSESDNIGWAAVTHQVGELLALAPVVLSDRYLATGSLTVNGILALASEAAAPLLLLPAVAPIASGLGGEVAVSRIRRVLVPFDGTEEDAKRLRPLLRRFRHGEIETVVLHSIADESRPKFWEGSGHHASAWRRELARRHGNEDATLRISMAEPERAVKLHAREADLVALLWKGNTSEDRAGIIRGVIGFPFSTPLLLIPSIWADQRLDHLSYCADEGSQAGLRTRVGHRNADLLSGEH